MKYLLRFVDRYLMFVDFRKKNSFDFLVRSVFRSPIPSPLVTPVIPSHIRYS